LDANALRGRMLFAPSLEYVERAFNHAKYGEFSAAPILEITVPSVADSTLAPAGKHVLSAVVQYVRQRVEGAKTFQEYLSTLVNASFEIQSRSDIPIRKITNGFSAGDEVNKAFLHHEEIFRKKWEHVLRQFGVRREAVAVVAYAISAMLDQTIYTFAITPEKNVARETLKVMLLAALDPLIPKRKLKEMPTFDTPPEAVVSTRKRQIDSPQATPRVASQPVLVRSSVRRQPARRASQAQKFRRGT